MPEVIIYTTKTCPYCVLAKELLSMRGYLYQEIDVTGNQALREELVGRTGGRKTVPQIFFDGVSMGGYDDLAARDRDGALPAPGDQQGV